MRSRARRSLIPDWNWWLIGMGVALMLALPVFWSLPRTLLVRVGGTLGGVLLFACGWLLLGAGLRPHGSARRGVLVAALLYVLVGLAWECVYVLTNPYGDRPHPVMLIFALLWPWHVAFVLGLFGLGPR